MLLRSEMPPPKNQGIKRKNFIFYSLCILLLLGVFSIYVTYRQQYIWGCDFYGYYTQGELLRSGKVFLETRLDPKKYPAVVPLSYHVRKGKAIPQYPPGFPLLLALAGCVGLEFYVTPFIGLLSIVLMYLLIKELTADRWIASMFSALWAFTPIVNWGSTALMSDLVAAFFIMLSLYLFYKEKYPCSGLALGFSLIVRPTNILYCLLFLPLLFSKKNRQWLKFGFFFSIPLSLYGIYNWLVYGLPWKTGYGDPTCDLISKVFWGHLQFYSTELVLQLTPLIIIPAIIPFIKKKKHIYFYGAWFLVFLIFYSFWRSGGDAWWWTRFLLPGIPPLFFLSALGVKEILAWAKSKGKKAGLYTGILFTALTITVIGYFIGFAQKHVELWETSKGKHYYICTKWVARTVPPGSIVGSLEFSGILRLYGGIESFFYPHYNSIKLIGDMMDKNVPVYLFLEPWNFKHTSLQNIYEVFEYKVIRKIEVGGQGYLLLKITGRRKPVARPKSTA